MKLRRVLAAGAGAAVALTMAAACGTSSDAGGGKAQASGSYDVFAVLPLSGARKAAGDAAATALKIAAADLNKRGGILGQQVKLEVVDDQGVPAQALTVLREKLDSGRMPDAVYAGLGGDETLAMLPLLSSKKIMNICITNTGPVNDPAKYPYTFSPTPALTAYGPQLAAQLKEKGFHKVGVLVSNDAPGETAAKLEGSAIKDAGMDVQVSEFDPKSLDFSAPIASLKSWGPDVVVFSTSNTAAEALVLSGRSKVGLDVPFYGDYATAGHLYQSAGEDGAWNVFVYTFQFALASSKVGGASALQSFIQSAKQAQGSLQGNSATTFVLPYDAVQLLAVAAEKAHSTDPDKIKTVLESAGGVTADHQGAFLAFPKYQFGPESHFNQSVADSAFGLQALGPLEDMQFHLPPTS